MSAEPAAHDRGGDRAATQVLRVEDVDAGYGALRVLHGVSLEVAPNEVVSVLGANGAGKTTLLRTVSGAIRPRAGTVSFLGERIDGRPAHTLARTGVGHVPSGRELFPDLTVEDNLMLGAYAVARDRQEALRERALELFPVLREMLRRRAGDLSGGQQQMLAIGRALMTGPKLLLLDEPSTGLAPKVVLTLFEALRQLIDDGDLSILLVEQNASVALALARRAYVLENGRCVLSGDAAQLKDDPRIVSAYLG